MTTPNIPHRVEYELEVPGTPEQVWQAIATAEGVTAWMVPAHFEPREGAALRFDMGTDASSHGRITAVEHPRRFAYEEDWATLVGQDGSGVTPLVTEFLVEARSGGTCVVKVVTSAFGSGADWENEFFEEMEHGWGPMLDNLRLYLTHFPGQRVTSTFASAQFGTSAEESIARLRARVAERPGCSIVRDLPRHFLVRLDTDGEGFVSFASFDVDGGSGVHMQGYLFGDGAIEYVARETPRWQELLDDLARHTHGASSTTT
jgi:uncharacterized protein YndB with AHSA1/START domain